MIRIFTVALLLAFAPLAHSEGYVLGQVGAIETKAAGFNGGDGAFALGGGFRFSRFLAVESTYANLGSTNGRTSETSGPTTSETTSTHDFKWKGRGVGIFGVGLWPLSSSADVVGRLGAYRVHGKTDQHDDIQVNNVSVAPAVQLSRTTSETSRTENVWAPAFGLGIQYRGAGTNVTWRAMYEKVNGRSGDFDRAQSLTFSVLINF
jgi:hypothetical protein